MPYCRVSTGAQAKSGLGLDVQRAAIEAASAQHGWDLLDWQIDRGETGKNTHRPAFRAGMAAIAEGHADGLVVAELDRICRSVIDFAELLEWFTAAGRALVILDPAIDTSTASGRLVANVFAAVAEWEADTIADRTADALQARRASGRPISRPAVADHHELAERVRAMRAAGMTLRAIADELNAAHVPTLRGGSEWRASAVQSALGYRRPVMPRRPNDLPPVPRRRRSRK